MNQNLETHDGVEHHDYDAVCEACDEVNPPGTLLCKTCGNNLRDQQARRFATQGAPEMQDDSLMQQPRRVMAGLLVVFGILLVFWVALNGDNIGEWLIQAQMAEASGGSAASAEQLWTGESASIFDDMVRALERAPITADEVDAAEFAQTGELLNGRYFLKDGDYDGAAVVGQAYVYLDEEELYFVATIQGAYEIRGKSSYELQALDVGVRFQDQYVGALGQGQILDSGSIVCYGEAGPDSIIYQAVAYYVP
jgi:hypothetical protein